MRLPSSPTLPMVTHLNDTYFHNTWNAPDDHGRANFQLYKAAERLQTGAVPVNLSVVGLPTTDKVYAVYRVAKHVFGRFVTLAPNEWVKDSDVFADDSVQMIAYSAVGRVIPRGCIYLRYDPIRSIVLVAINRIYTSGCIGEAYPDLYMTLNKDTTRSTPQIISLYQVSTAVGSTTTVQIVTAAIVAARTTYPVRTLVYLNGWTYDAADVPTLVNNDIVCIVSDPDISGVCDIAVDDNLTGYYSDLYGEYREILHVPKNVNPNNYLITHDLVSLVVFAGGTSKRGVYGHRIDPHGIESITFNDFSVSRSVLQGFMNGLGATSVRVRLYIRLPVHRLPLPSEAARIEDLYSLPDTEIKLQLAGTSQHQIVEWKASNLEKSPFLNLMYQFNGFGITDLLPQYTAAMGYYNVAATLSQAILYYTYQGGEVEIPKPARLWGYDCKIIVYADGRKLPDYAIGIIANNDRSFTLGFHTGSYVAVGSRIAVYITEGGDRVPIKWNPTSDNRAIVLDHDDYQVVKIINYGTPKPVWKSTASSGYQLIPVSPGDYQIVISPQGGVSFVIGAGHYSDHLYLIPKCGLTTLSYPLDSILAAKEPIILPLQMTDIDGGVLPLIANQAMEIYINGYRLIEDVDYTCNPIMGDNNDILQTLLEVSNMDYLNLQSTGNVLEVVVHGDTAISHDRGYVISNMMHRDEPPMVWNKSCGRAYVHGLLVEKVTETGNTLVSTQPLSNGAPYYLEWSLPYSVSKLMYSIPSSTDINLRTRVDAVLGYQAPIYPNTVLVDHLYALYSPYLAKIVSDVASGAFTIINEPKDDQFLKQFSAYDTLYSRDALVGAANPFLDRRFVTLAAHYTNFAVQDSLQMILVQRLISLVLTPAQLSISEVLV